MAEQAARPRMQHTASTGQKQGRGAVAAAPPLPPCCTRSQLSVLQLPPPRTYLLSPHAKRRVAATPAHAARSLVRRRCARMADAPAPPAQPTAACSPPRLPLMSLDSSLPPVRHEEEEQQTGFLLTAETAPVIRHTQGMPDTGARRWCSGWPGGRQEEQSAMSSGARREHMLWASHGSRGEIRELTASVTPGAALLAAPPRPHTPRPA